VLVGESSPIASNPNQQAITRGMNLAAEDLGWTTQTLDANLSPDQQVTDIDSLLNLGAKGVVTWTLDPGAVAAAYERAQGEGVPVVDFGGAPTANSQVWDARGYDCRIAAQWAAYIAERAPGAKVLVVGGPPVPAITTYTDCFVEEAEKAGLVVAGKQDNVNDTAATAQPLVENMLTQNPDVGAIWCYNDPSCLGAGAVVRAAGKPIWKEGESDEGVIIVGANGSQEAIDAIADGGMTGTYDPLPDVMGSTAVAVLAQHLDDGVPIDQLPKVIVIEGTFWDASNIADYVPPLERDVTVQPVPEEWIVE
jgi:ribose transport system substrate-binding protein